MSKLFLFYIIQEHEKIRSQLQPGCELEMVIAPIMVSSDASFISGVVDLEFNMTATWSLTYPTFD